MADIFHPHRHLHARGGHADGWALARALAGGLVAIALLTALAAGLAGAAVYALVWLFTALAG